MTGPTKTLARLGVGAVSAATLVSSMIALAPAANAAPTSLTITPATQTGATDTCLDYTVTVNGATTADKANQTVTVLAHPNQSTTSVSFCTAGGAASGTGGTGGGAGNDTTAKFTTDSTGTVTVGVSSVNSSSSATLTAFIDNNSNNTPDAGDLIGDATAAANWTDGGADNVATVTVSPTTDSAAPGETRTYTATLKNDDTTPHVVPGVTPRVQLENSGGTVLAGPTDCTQSDNSGQSTCTVAFPSNAAVGTDTVRVFVNQGGAGSTPGFDTGEPNATSTVTVFTPPTSDAIAVTCNGGSGASSSCSVPASNSAGVTFTAHTTNTSGDDNGVHVRFAFTGSSESGATITPSTGECTTAGSGTCSVTVAATQANRAPGGKITGTATIRGTSTSSSATATFTNTTADARNVTLTPATQNETPGGVATVTATALDSTGAPVQGVNVFFTESGPGSFRSGASQAEAVTGADGTASVDLTSVSTESGDETVTADITGTNQCAAAAGTGTAPNGQPVPTSQSAGNCTATATVTIAKPTPPAKTVQKPTLKITTVNKHHRHLHATTHPHSKGADVHFYTVSNGHHHLIGSATAGHAGGAGVTVKLAKGTHHIDCRVVHPGSHVDSKYSSTHTVHIKK